MDKYILFQRYLDVCNQALDANKDRFPFKQILVPAHPINRPRMVEVSIIDDRPDDKFTIVMEGNKMTGKRHDECVNCQCDGKWRIPKSYMEEVINHPEEYIKNPAKIDWEWMQLSSN